MTLKEKFIKESIDIRYQVLEPEKFEKISDDYAIEFAEWCIEWRVGFFDSTKEGILYTYGGLEQKFKMKELLEIFKKEKGW
jgi:hypothetical protein